MREIPPDNHDVPEPDQGAPETTDPAASEVSVTDEFPEVTQQEIGEQLAGVTAMHEIEEPDDWHDGISENAGVLPASPVEETGAAPALATDGADSGSQPPRDPPVSDERCPEDDDEGETAEIAELVTRDLRGEILAVQLAEHYRKYEGGGPEAEDRMRMDWQTGTYLRDYVRYASRQGDRMSQEEEGRTETSCIYDLSADNGSSITLAYTEERSPDKHFPDQIATIGMSFDHETEPEGTSESPVEVQYQFRRFADDEGRNLQSHIEKTVSTEEGSETTDRVPSNEIRELLHIVDQAREHQDDTQEIEPEHETQGVQHVNRFDYVGPAITAFPRELDVRAMDEYLDKLPSEAINVPEFWGPAPAEAGTAKMLVHAFCEDIGVEVFSRQHGIDFVHVYPPQSADALKRRVPFPPNTDSTTEYPSGHQHIIGTPNTRTMLAALTRVAITDVTRTAIEPLVDVDDDGNFYLEGIRPIQTGYTELETGDLEGATQALTELTTIQLMRDYWPSVSASDIGAEFVRPNCPESTALMDRIISSAEDPERLYRTLQRGMIVGPGDTARQALTPILGDNGLLSLSTMDPYDAGSVIRTAEALGYYDIDFSNNLTAGDLLHWLKPLPPRR